MKLTDIHEGDRLKVTDNISCLGRGAVCVVKIDAVRGPFIECAMGVHHLDYEVDDDGEIVGFVKV